MHVPSPAKERSSSGLTFGLASRDDDAGLRRLLRDCVMEGQISIAAEREPEFFLGETVAGTEHQTLVARDQDGRIVGMGGRTVREMWIDGKPRRVGYLGQLRLEPAYRNMARVIRTGYKMLRELHEAGDVPFYLTSIAESNATARRLLEAGLPGFPTYCPVGDLRTLVLATGRYGPPSPAAPRFAPEVLPQPPALRARPAPRPVRRRAGGQPAMCRGAEACAGEPVDLEEIATLLAHHNAARQFAPVWSAADLADPDRARHLGPADWVIVRKEGRLAGCAAVWDQRGFKQLRIRGYTGRLARWRSVVDLAAHAIGLPPLPPPGSLLEMGYLSHLALAREDVDVLLVLVAAARDLAASRGMSCLALGLAANGPLFAALQARLRFIEYRTILYLVHWPDGLPAVSALGPRLAQPEIAIL